MFGQGSIQSAPCCGAGEAGGHKSFTRIRTWRAVGLNCRSLDVDSSGSYVRYCCSNLWERNKSKVLHTSSSSPSESLSEPARAPRLPPLSPPSPVAAAAAGLLMTIRSGSLAPTGTTVPAACSPVDLVKRLMMFSAPPRTCPLAPVDLARLLASLLWPRTASPSLSLSLSSFVEGSSLGGSRNLPGGRAEATQKWFEQN